MSGLSWPHYVTEGSTLQLKATGLTPYSTYALRFSSSHSDDHGTPTVDGIATIKNSSYYDWSPSGTSSTISIPIIQDNISDKSEELSFWLYQKYTGGRYESMQLQGSTIIDPRSAPKITATYQTSSNSAYAALVNNGSINEGATVSINLSNSLPYMTQYYTLTGIDSSDVSSPLTGQFATGENGTNSLLFTFLNDEKAEGTEKVKFTVYNDSSRTDQTASFNFSLNDTSTSPQLTVKTGIYRGDTSSPAYIDEGLSLIHISEPTRP